MRRVVTEAFNDEDLDYLVRNCPSLRSLSLGAVHVTGSSLQLLNNLHQSFEEFTYDRSIYRQSTDYYTQTAAALMDVLRQCTNLTKVSLTGDALHSVNLEELRAFGHLLYELEINRFLGPQNMVEAVSDLLVSCVNLRKVSYKGDEDPLIITARSCPLLEELELRSIVFDDEEEAPGIIILTRRHCKHFRTLTLGSCDLSASSLRSIARVETLRELTFYQCSGLTDAGMAELSTMRLVRLSIDEHSENNGWSGASVLSFVGANISQTLEALDLSVYDGMMAPFDDDIIATVLASCHHLTSVDIYIGQDGCVFGRNGLAGLQAIARGCPLLAEINLNLTVPGLHYIATHCPNLKKCTCTVDVGDGVRGQLRMLYPKVQWNFHFDSNSEGGDGEGGDG
jgi:hypothetical protein